MFRTLIRTVFARSAGQSNGRVPSSLSASQQSTLARLQPNEPASVDNSGEDRPRAAAAAESSKNAAIFKILAREPFRLSKGLFDRETINRLSVISSDRLLSLVIDLHEHGITGVNLAEILKNYNDYSLLTREKISQCVCMLRELPLRAKVYQYVLANNPNIVFLSERQLRSRVRDLKQFFTNRHLDRLFMSTPSILTNSMDSFEYKFTYVFAKMGIEQTDMSKTRLFDHPIEHIRQRHLFLSRAGIFRNLKEKGFVRSSEDEFRNPKLVDIIDSNLDYFLFKCTKGVFTAEDYEMFGVLIREENFDKELLGYRIGKKLQNQILESLKRSETTDKDDDWDANNEPEETTTRAGDDGIEEASNSTKQRRAKPSKRRV